MTGVLGISQGTWSYLVTSQDWNLHVMSRDTCIYQSTPIQHQLPKGLSSLIMSKPSVPSVSFPHTFAWDTISMQANESTTTGQSLHPTLSAQVFPFYR